MGFKLLLFPDFCTGTTRPKIQNNFAGYARSTFMIRVCSIVLLLKGLSIIICTNCVSYCNSLSGKLFQILIYFIGNKYYAIAHF